MATKYKVKFTATFDAIVTVEDGETLSDAVRDINIPENKQCGYDAGTFEPAAFAMNLTTGESVLLDPSDFVS